MRIITYKEQAYACSSGESVLECLERQGIMVPSSCRTGVCQSCMMRATQGVAPPKSQNGLKSTLRAQNYFLACVCQPEEDLVVTLAGEEALQHTSATLILREKLNKDIFRLSLTCRTPFEYHAGQFVHLYRPDGLMRSYSIANVPEADGVIELHVRRLPGGAMTGWLHDALKIGESLDIAGPFGNCFYTPGNPEQGLLLIGTGSGLAPLWGIANDALQQGHIGPIRLYHGSWNPHGLYLVDELSALSARHDQVHYGPCVDSEALTQHSAGRADHIAFSDLKNLKGWRVFLCGHPELVQSAKKRAFLAGASMRDIYADPFVLTGTGPVVTS